MSLFADPSALWLLLVLPALWLIGRHARTLRAAALARFANPALLGEGSALPAAGGWVRPVLRLVGLGLVVLALARPQLGRQPKELARTGRDLIVALDLSRSMQVADVGGTRLERAKRLAWQLISARPGDRVGLVIFGGAGFLQLPPTSDLATFQLFLEAASPDDIGDPATDVSAGLRVAERALRREGSVLGSRAVVLLTDGERTEGPIDPALEVYRAARLPVFAVGIGTPDGGRVPNDSGAAEGPWHLDNIGRPVVSSLDEADLRNIAASTGGLYARYDDATALEALQRALTGLQARTLASQPATEPREWYQWPLLLGILLLVVDLFLAGERPAAAPPVRPRRLEWGVAALLLLLAPSLSCTARARNATRGEQLYDQGKFLEAYESYESILRQQGGSEVRYNAGNALYRMRQYSEAAKTWRQALGGASRQLKHDAYFNMGNAFVRADEDANALSGYIERALDAYEEALRLDPNDVDAKWNLEIALVRRGDVTQEGSRGRGGRANYGRGSNEEGYEGNRESAVGAMAGGGSGGDEGESVEDLDPEQARALLEAIERQQLSTHEGRRPAGGGSGGRDW